MTGRPLFIVWRAAPGCPPGFLPQGMEGRWDHRPAGPPPSLLFEPPGEPGATVIRTSRIEHRDDDASAEVWEVHPVAGNYDPDPAARLALFGPA